MSPARAAAARGPAGATRGSAIKLGADVTARLVALATWVAVAWSLGVPELGVFAALAGVAALLAEAGGFGLAGTASWALPRGTLTLPSLIRARLVSSAPPALAAGAAAALALAGATGGAGPDTGPERLLVASVLVMHSTCAGWCEFLGVALRCRGRAGAEASILVGLRVAVAGCVWLAAGEGATMRGLASAQLLGSVSTLLAAALLVALTPAAPARDAGEGIGQALRAARPIAVASVLAHGALRLELVLLLVLATPYDAGLFAVALRLLEALLAVPHAVAAGAMPALVRESRAGPQTSAARDAAAAWIALLAVPAAVGAMLLAPELLAVFGGDYAAGAPVLRLLAPAIVAGFASTLLLYGLAAAGEAARTPRLVATRLAVAAALALLLVPGAGAAGAALGFAAAETLLAVRAGRACATAGFAIPLARPLARGALASLPMAAVVAVVEAPLPIAVAGGVAVYGATLAAAWRVSRVRRAEGAGRGRRRP